jgi:hypothetical protein
LGASDDSEIVETAETDGAAKPAELSSTGPTDADLAELEALEEPLDDRPLNVDEWLDREDLDRLEYDRIVDDLYPGTPQDGGPAGHIHRDTDAVQSWMQEMRRL